MITTFCEKRLAPVFAPEDVEILRRHLIDLLERNEYPTYRGSRLDVRALAEGLGLDARRLMAQEIEPSADIRRGCASHHRKIAASGSL